MALELDKMTRLPGDEAFRRESIKGTQWESTYAGALSFMRRKYTRDLTGVDIAVTGIPFDQAVSHRPGTRFGPEGMRKASAENRLTRVGWEELVIKCWISSGMSSGRSRSGGR